MLTEVRYDFFGVRESGSRFSALSLTRGVDRIDSRVYKAKIVANRLPMTQEAEKSDLDNVLLSVWRQVLLERKKRVTLGDNSYPVQHTAKSKLAQVDFDFAGQRIRGLQQNPATSSRWAELARNGAKVMQFLVAGRYIAAISDAKITHFGKK